MPLIQFIVPYCFTRHFVPNCLDKISIFPEFSTSQFSLYRWISQKKFACTYAFENSHDLFTGISRWYTCKYIHMIMCYFRLLYFTISSWKYLFKQLFYDISDLFVQYPFSIFGCPHRRVSRMINCMAHSFDGHAAYYTNLLNQHNPFLPLRPHAVSRVGFS